MNITSNGIQMSFMFKKNKSSPWQAITEIANENNMNIVDVFYSLNAAMRNEVLKEVEYFSKINLQ